MPLAQKEASESASEKRPFRSIIWSLVPLVCLSSGAGSPGPSWHQASGRGAAPKTCAWCLPPAVSFGIPVPLQSRAPLTSEMSSFQTNRLCSLPSLGEITEKSQCPMTPLNLVSEHSGNSFRLEQQSVSAHLLAGGHLQQ